MDSRSGFWGTVAGFVPVLLVGIGVWASLGSGTRRNVADRPLSEPPFPFPPAATGDIGRVHGPSPDARDGVPAAIPGAGKPVMGMPPLNGMPWDDPSAPIPPIGRDASREGSDQGGKLYASACARCHGTDGRGGGPEASELSTSVRDLTAPEEFVARSSVQGTVPFDADIYRTLRRGLPGTAMPSYRNLAPDGLWDLVAFVKTLSPHYGDPARAPKEAYAPAGAPADLRSLLAEGKALYLDLDCARCHGEDGKGNPAAGLVDSRGKPFATTDFVSGGGRFLCGMSPRDVARTFLIGMPGTPMESYLESLYGIGCDPRVMPAESRAAGDRKLWALVAYTIKLVEEAK